MKSSTLRANLDEHRGAAVSLAAASTKYVQPLPERPLDVSPPGVMHEGPDRGALSDTMQTDRSERHEARSAIATLSIGLLGGFRVERGGTRIPDYAWHRRSAKRLTKLLATCPSHSLHREQVIEILWPDAVGDSARNGVAKALHAARRALEPDRMARGDSAYLRARDEMITLNADHVRVDADHFQQLAQRGLQLATSSAYEAALAAYTGVLLPEDLYETWPTQRRQYLADLNVRLLVALGEELAKRGAYGAAIDRLRSAVQEDPTREDVHRQLMRLYGAMGARGLALRQFEICRALLREELDVTPDGETIALYQAMFADEHAHFPGSHDMALHSLSERLDPSASPAP